MSLVNFCSASLNSPTVPLVIEFRLGRAMIERSGRNFASVHSPEIAIALSSRKGCVTSDPESRMNCAGRSSKIVRRKFSFQQLSSLTCG